MPVIDQFISDHAAVLCPLNSVKPPAVAKKIKYRQLKAIDIDALRADLRDSDLCTKEFTDVDEMASCYNSTLQAILNKHAPLKTKTVVNRKRVPWFNSQMKAAIRDRRKAERTWRKSKSAHDLGVFKAKKNRATFITNQARCEYYTSHIQENSSNQRKLFQSTKALLCDAKDISFPSGDPDRLANDFGNFFVQKIERINSSLADLSAQSQLPPHADEPPHVDEHSVCAHGRFTSFKSLTQDQVRMLIDKAPKKSCQLDPIPTSIVVQSLDILLPVITKLVNLSFETGQFAGTWKEALVLPSLKKPNLDIAYKNFRPVSNLAYISKLSERACVHQFTEYLTVTERQSLLQSAYKPLHSTETALLKVKNDILMSMNQQHVTLLVLLDLSAAFDTIHHDKLIQRLESDCGVAGNALSWFKSYLSDRFQRVSVNGGLSKEFPLCQGVPQGSCLGPLLFIIYTRKLFDIVERHLPQVHCYADDTQLYVSFRPNQSAEADAALKSMTDCISDVRGWMISDNLMLNDDKTEFLILGTRQQLAKVNIDNIKVGSAKVSPVSAVRNLGSWFDSQLTMSSHINKLCSVAFYHLCNIRRIRKYLSQETAGTLVHAFITSRIDYCNSLLYGLPSNQLAKIQRVLNASARLVCNAPRFCHITPIMCDLHWLPIRARINFKVLLLTFKALHGLAPQYLQSLISAKTSRYNLRGSNTLLLTMPSVKSKATLGDRAFAIAAPSLWNSLPSELRSITCLTSFKAHLKTFLFRHAYT